MIICFSGTGNTRHIADLLQDMLGDEIRRFPPGLMAQPSRISLHVDDGRIIWLCPVHAWALPHVVQKVLEVAQITSDSPITHHLVLTCGDDMGYADKAFRRLVEKRGDKVGCVYSVQMPNSYVCLPGFDVDKPEVAQAKLDACAARTERIAQDIEAGNSSVDVVRGSFPWLKTHLLNGFFRKFLMSPSRFRVNSNCLSCGRCARNCPLTNISMVNGHPQWGKNCLMCLRCYHCCPNHSVEYGPYTKNKGHYLCPGYTLKQ